MDKMRVTVIDDVEEVAVVDDVLQFSRVEEESSEEARKPAGYLLGGEGQARLYAFGCESI
jgi:hypothetical protein